MVGVVGEPVSLPCLYSGPPLDARNFSLEWRSGGGQVLLRAGWAEGRPTGTDIGTDTGTGTARLPEDALQNGDFALELSAVPALRGPQTFHLTLVVGGEEEEGPPLCTVCLRTGEVHVCVCVCVCVCELYSLRSYQTGVKVSPVASRASDALWVFSGGLCLGVAVLVAAAIIYQVMLDKSHKKLGKTHKR